MSKQFTPCPACGAVGEVGTKCLFCSTIITLKEGEVSYSERIPQRRTVTPQRYAEKISIYHNVKPIRYGENLLMVSIGDQHGLVNLNGDIVYPLGNDEIESVSFDTVGLGHTYEETLREASSYWDNFSSKWVQEEAIKRDRFKANGYFNLYTGEYADNLGFVKDKDNPKKLYRVDVKKGWQRINTYTNLEGELHSYDYAEQIVLPDATAVLCKRKMYLLHHANECSLWILYDSWEDRDYFNNIYISNRAYEDALEAEPTSPMCVLEGIQDKYTIEVNNRVVQIVVRTSSGIDVPLTLAKKKYGDTSWSHNNFDKIYNEWCKATGKHIPESEIELDECEDESSINYKESQNNDGTIWGHSKTEWLICIIGIILFILFKVF